MTVAVERRPILPRKPKKTQDKLKALQLMAIAGGKLQQKFDHAHKFDHLLCLGAEPPVGDDE